MTPRYETKHLVAAVATVLVWSSAFSAVSLAVGPGGGYGPGELALLRFLVASATMGIVALAVRMRLPKREDVGRIALAALFGITIYHLAFTFGETGVSPSASALIIASGPIWTALLANAFLGERLNGFGWAGVAMAFAGVAAIALGEGKGGLTVEPMAVVTLLAALSTATYFVLSKKPLRTYSAVEFTSYVIWFGTIPLLVFAPGLAHQLPAAPAWSTWLIVFLGVFPGALAYVMWSYALSGMPASTTASFLYSSPVLATIIAWVVQRSVPSAATVAGGVLALAGVILVQAKGRPGERIEVCVAEGPEEYAAVVGLVEELVEWLSARFSTDRSYYAPELADFTSMYGGERGRAFLAKVDGVAAGCVVFRDFGDGVAELRRMYVRPAYRRRGLARRLLRAAMAEAARIGYRRLQFVTSTEFEGAIELYESEGFAPMDIYRPVVSETIAAYGLDL